jgi:putative Holliday junction resolvase
MRPMTMMGVDFGTRRIGIALTTSGVLATPFTVLRNDGDRDDVARRIAAIAHEHGVERIVLGNPARTGDTPMHERFQSLARLIARATGCDVVLWDESYSTTEASSLRRERGRQKGKRDPRPIDDEAAAVILQAYLDAAARGAPA